MTTYYVDPLNGTTSGAGTTHTDALSSYADLFNGNLVGGITLGDTVYFMASTADNTNNAYLGAFEFGGGGEHGSTSGIVRLIGVNPTTLEEDGTKYTLIARDNFYGGIHFEIEYALYRNFRILGKMDTYSSGSNGSTWVNCEFRDAYGGYTLNNFNYFFGLDNQSHNFRNCIAIKSGTGNLESFAFRGGSVYGAGHLFESCEFLGFVNGPVFSAQNTTTKGKTSFVNCRFKDVESAFHFGTNGDREGEHLVANCIFDNTSGSACKIADLDDDTRRDVPKAGMFLGNLFNDIGGYVYEYTSPAATEINVFKDGRNCDSEMMWAGNVYQNVTSGVHSLSFNSEVLARQWTWNDGDTAAAFGLTYGSEGENLMVVTGDNVVFNHWNGVNNVGLGVFLKEFTEAVVSATIPEFGESF